MMTKTMPVAQLLSALVEVDTTNPPGNERALAQLVAQMMTPFGYSCDVVDCGEGRASLVASRRFGSGFKYVMNGHLDVVPATGSWSSDPFRAQIRDGRLYARGAADMKGGVAAMILAAQHLAMNPQDLHGEVVLNLVADEELYNRGTLSTKPCWEDADLVVIGEPTQLQIHVAHKGTVRFHLKVKGHSCHSSMPEIGVNAVSMMALAIQQLEAYGRTLVTRKYPLMKPPTLTVTGIAGGEKDNIVPGLCTATLDRRIIPGETGDSVEAEIRAVLDAIARENPEFVYELDRYICLEAGYIAQDHPCVRQAETVYRACFAEPAIVKSFPATCEQAIFSRSGVPAMVFGPGSIDQAHIVDEYVELEQLERAAVFYESFARSLLA